MQRSIWTTVPVLLMLAACGGGSESSEAPAALAECDPANPDTHAECGTVLVALTDAEGGFLSYAVDVLSLELQAANGRVVETLPNSTRVNFTDYVDLTELVSAATVPPGTYVSGTIRLDYRDAEVFVEAGGESKAAVVTGADGEALSSTELTIQLSNRDRLIVTRGRPALLQLDFDLEASHSVDTVPTPAIAESEAFILAEVVPVDEKDIRVRGRLLDVSADAMTYTVAIRPFHDRDGDFGRVTVHVDDDTEFEVNGEARLGSEGLRALSAAGNGTLTVAAGTLNVESREFTAKRVLAGTSVPGVERDAVIGNIIQRDGNLLTVRGATLIPSDRRAHFHDDIVVEVGPNTRVFRDGDRGGDYSIDDLSIGQRLTVRGDLTTAAVTDANAPQLRIDATSGVIRMHLTQLSGIVNTVMPGQTDIKLHAIDRRRVQIFDFTGTGAEEDADPDNYEVATGDLTLASFAAGKPIVARGFPTAFGMAPPDFSGRTVIDYTDVRSALGVGWGSEGTLKPFTGIGGDGLTLNNRNEDIAVRHYIKQGPILIDLTKLDSDTVIVPTDSGRALYYIKSSDSLRQYSDFADFVADLSGSLNGATAARSLHAHGHYDAAANILTARKIGIYLLEP